MENTSDPTLYHYPPPALDAGLPACTPLDYGGEYDDYNRSEGSRVGNLSGGAWGAAGGNVSGGGRGAWRGAAGVLCDPEPPLEYVNPLDDTLTKSIFILLYAVVFLLAFVGKCPCSVVYIATYYVCGLTALRTIQSVYSPKQQSPILCKRVTYVG